jgi:hypothetical protein
VTDWLAEMVSAARDPDDRYRRAPQVLRDSRSSELDDAELLNELAQRLRADAKARRAWQSYSYDKRWSPSPYLEGLEVGLYDSGYRDVESFDDASVAVAAFILRERDWLLRPL